MLDAGLRHRPFPDDTASLLPGLLIVTRTGLSPASDDELTNQPSTIYMINHQLSGHTKGNPYLKGALGDAAAAAAKTNTFLGERYRRIVKRRGKLKALVAVARSILRIIWQLLTDPTARFRDLGADYHTTRINTERRTRNYVTQLMAMGYRVTLEPAA